MSGGALAGIRVVDLTTVVVGPTATLYLADYGADVIKVEAPGGDLLRSIGGQSNSGELSGKFMHFNRNKRSLALDLKREEGRDALHRLLATADVFIANVRPAALERLGFGVEALRGRHPRLILCNLMGFGRGGRYRDRPAYDTIIQGLSGVTDCNARVLGEPRFVPMVFADHVVGLIAAQCILAALFAREKSGEGQAIEVPMFENVAAFVLAEHMGDFTFVPPRGKSGDARVLDPLAKPIATMDGFICVSANTDAQAFALFDAIGRPELKSDPRFSSVKARLANVRAYFEVRAAGLRTRTTQEWLAVLEKADVPAGRVHTIESLAADEHLAEVGFFRRVEHPVEGEIIDLAFSNRFSAGGRQDIKPAPLMGGDSVEILREIGYRNEEIDELVRSRVTIDGRTASGNKCDNPQASSQRAQGKPEMNRRHLLRRGGALLLAAGVPRPALAQAWPSRNITLVVPFPPGGSNDVFARAIADKLAAALGVAVIIDNRGGAGGTIGSSAVARMPPDGYTLMIGHIGTLGVNPSLYPNLSYDTLTSFDYVAPLGLVPNILVVHPSLPAKTVQELIDYAHANPGKLNYSTAGSGSAADIAMAAFNLAAKTRMVPVPYRGTAPALTDLLAGQVQLTMTGSTAVLQHVHAGTMRGLGVSTLKRLSVAPEIPAIAETLPGFEASQWYGIVAPAHTPAPILKRYYEEIRRIMKLPDVKERLAAEGVDPWDVTPEQFRNHVAAEIPRWKAVVEAAKINAPR